MRSATICSKLCADCQRRAQTNPLRIFDCKVPADQPIIDAFRTPRTFSARSAARTSRAVKRHLDAVGIPFRVSHRLVRGLDYYTRTTFEILGASLGAQNALLGGGRYDGLVKSSAARIVRGSVSPPGSNARAGDAGARPTRRDGRHLRGGHRRRGARRVDCARSPSCGAPDSAAQMEYDARGVKAQLKRADRLRRRARVIVGGDELARGEVTVRDMKTGEQTSSP